MSSVDERIQSLRKLMIERGMDAYIVPSSDPHQSEYTPEHWKSRKFISGFTGSAGTALIMRGMSGLWTDGRYFIQAEKELSQSEMKLFCMQQEGVPTLEEYLSQNLPSDSVVGFHGCTTSCTSAETLNKTFTDLGKTVEFIYDEDLIGYIWTDRPELPKDPVFILDEKYSGISAFDKIKMVREKMKLKGSSHYLVSTLDDIAWLLNVRGNDVSCTPVVISYALIEENKATWFVNQEKSTNEVETYLTKNGIDIQDYTKLPEYLKDISAQSRFYYDPGKTSVWAISHVESNIRRATGPDLVWQLKAIKNSVEIENLRKTHIKDSVALVKFATWLYKMVPFGEVTEISAASQLESYRKEVSNYQGPSFDTIAAYLDHGAMMHYKATPEDQYKLGSKGLFLLDSGGQFLDGTTDITRTFGLGELTEEEKKDFTLTLKSHIALAEAIFLYGSTGTHLDPIARQVMWKEYLDYKCGTGHGVGFFLSVHEGPQRIAPLLNDTVLEAGMVVTNEPGVYKQGKYGIRIENTLLVDKRQKTECGQFMGFEILSYFPIDIHAINKDILEKHEIDWLNNYHQKVWKKLSPHLSGEELHWLKGAVSPI